MDSSRAQRALGSLRDPIRDISPMPIVSDIIMSAAAPARTPLPALKPSHPERRPADQVKSESKAKGKKRARSPLGADSMVCDSWKATAWLLERCEMAGVKFARL